jgi:hypothetical protein
MAQPKNAGRLCVSRKAEEREAVRLCLGLRQVFNESERPYLPRIRVAEIVTEAGDLIFSNPGLPEAIGAE